MTPRYNEQGEYMYSDDCDDTSAMTKADYATQYADEDDDYLRKNKNAYTYDDRQNITF